MVSTPDIGSQGPLFKSCWRQNSAQNCMVIHCAELFTIILALYRYDLNNVERDINHQIIVIICENKSMPMAILVLSKVGS